MGNREASRSVVDSPADSAPVGSVPFTRGVALFSPRHQPLPDLEGRNCPGPVLYPCWRAVVCTIACPTTRCGSSPNVRPAPPSTSVPVTMRHPISPNRRKLQQEAGLTRYEKYTRPPQDASPLPVAAVGSGSLCPSKPAPPGFPLASTLPALRATCRECTGKMRHKHTRQWPQAAENGGLNPATRNSIASGKMRHQLPLGGTLRIHASSLGRLRESPGCLAALCWYDREVVTADENRDLRILSLV
jgi:hypothetical protein